MDEPHRVELYGADVRALLVVDGVGERVSRVEIAEDDVAADREERAVEADGIARGASNVEEVLLSARRSARERAEPQVQGRLFHDEGCNWGERGGQRRVTTRRGSRS